MCNKLSNINAQQTFIAKLKHNESSPIKSLQLYVKPSDINKDYSSLQPVSLKPTIKRTSPNSKRLTPSKSENKIKNKSVHFKDNISIIEEEEEPNNPIQLELNEANKTIEALKNTIENEKKRYANTEINLKNEYQEQLTQRFRAIEKLINEKEQLTIKIKELKESNKEANEEWNSKYLEEQERHLIELKKAKEQTINQESQKRDKWIIEKEQEIRQNTVKLMQPDIEKLIQNQRIEINEIKKKYNEELETIKAKIIAEYENKHEMYTKEYNAQTESNIKAIKNEYEEKIKKQNQNNQEQIEEIKNRWTSIIESERQQYETIRKKDSKQWEAEKNSIIESYECKIKALHNKHNEYIKQQESKNNQNILEIKGSNEKDINDAKERIINEQKLETKASLKLLQTQIIKEKNNEKKLEMAKLRDAFSLEKKSIIKEYEAKIQEIIDRYTLQVESQNAALERWTSLYADTKNENGEIKKIQSNDCTKLQDIRNQLAQKSTEVEILTHKINSLQYMENHVTEIVKSKEKEMQEINGISNKRQEEQHSNDMKGVKEEYEQRINAINESHQAKISHIIQSQESMNASIEAKDRAIKELKSTVSIKESQIQKYIELMDKQRKDLLFAK